MPFDAIIWDLDDDPDGNVWSTALRKKKLKKCSRM